MEEQNKSVNLLYIFLLPTLLHLLCFITKTQAITNQNISSYSMDQHRKASAIFVFGDSTVDPGNNNFIPTLFRGNFMPYGRDFSGRKSTGRFSNGRLATDFIASYVGVKDYVPPYLDPDLTTEDIMSGVSFASGGTGYDPMTAQIGNVLTMPKQLEYFKEYKKRIVAKIGRQQAQEHIKEGIFVISAGTNDFVVNYFMLPLRRKVYNVPSYERFVIQRAKQFLQSLWAEGARRMLVVGLPPMGCLPMVITLKSAKGEAINHRSCLDNYSSVGRDYNNILQKELNNLQNSFASSGTRISYFDIYNPAMELIQGYKKFGFEDVLRGCCGTGYLEASFLCNPLSYVCPDPSKYLFFDSIHPTETTYYYVFKNVCPVIDRLLQGI